MTSPPPSAAGPTAPEPGADSAARPGFPLPPAVAAILLLEVALFCWSVGKFFCGDSLFFLWYRVETPSQVLFALTHPDHLHSYRPLTQLFFSLVLFPLFGLNPLGYHLAALGWHLLVSLLVYRLLRELVARPAAALAGLLFFGAHAVDFYLTYDASFLPDFSLGLFYVVTLLCYAAFFRTRRGLWLAGAVASFVLALLSKEIAVTLPAGIVVVDLLLRRRGQDHSGERGRRWWQPGNSVIPFLATAALYLGWLLYVNGGRVYPGGASEPYALTLDPALLKLKLRYLAWLANFPTQFARRGWPAYAAVLAMLGALAWVLARLAPSARRIRRELLLCALWALASLLPVLFIVQVPMKHNLYVPLMAGAVGLALLVEAAHTDLRRALPGWRWAAVAFLAATALQVPGDLKYSWVGEASDIARASLQAVKRAHPTLPGGAMLYVLPTSVKGMASWYFQGGALFNLFYRDATLRTRFADLGHQLPADFVTHPEIFLFHFHDQRLWDVTRTYKRDAGDSASYRLLETIARARVESKFAWKQDDLPDTGDVTAVRPLGRNGQSRLALIMVAGTRVRLALPALPADSVLQVGITLAGPLKSGTRGRIFFEDPQSRESRLLLSATLDAADAGRWWDREVDLSALAGRAGTLVLESAPDHEADWVAWSHLRIIARTNPWFTETSLETDQALPPRDLRLLDRFEEAQVSFDRREVYPDYSKFDTPNGRPAFLFASRRGDPGHFAMVTIAGASVRFALERVPPAGALEIAAINLGKLGDGVRGRVFVEDRAGREKIFDELFPPRGRQWLSRTLSLEKWAGQAVTLVFEGSSGPNRETIGDWCAWARLRIVSAPSP